MRAIRTWLWALYAWAVTLPVLAEDAEESRSAAFRAVEGAQTEDVPGGTLMIVAYMTALVLLVGYIARLGMMQRRTSTEVERLAALLAEREARD